MAAGGAHLPLAAYPPRRASGAPLLVVLAMHLLAAWWWALSSSTVTWRGGTATALREFIIVPVLPRVPPPAPAPVTPAAPVARPAASARAPDRAITVVPPTTTAGAAPASADPAPADSSADPPGAPAAQPGESTASRALRAAGAADQALRDGKLAPLSPPDTPWNRFVRGVEGARNDTSRTLVSDTYTAPDGTVIYRFRLHGKVWCRTGGHVRPSIGGAEGGGAAQFDTRGGEGAAGAIACPNSAEFRPE